MSTLALTGAQALWFAPLSIPICLWAAYTDLKSLRIPNAAVLAMLAVFAVTGLFALGLADYLWRYAHFAVVLAVGFVLWALPGFGFGAGDAKPFGLQVIGQYITLGGLIFNNQNMG